MTAPDTSNTAPAGASKVDPESVALRASPRPVTRLNRRMLAFGTGALAAAVLGGTFWSLQSNKHQRNPATELFNVDRISRADKLDQLPKDYAGIAQKQQPPVLGEPLPGDLGHAMVKAQQSKETRSPAGGVDPAQTERLATEEAARSSVFFRSGANSAVSKSGGMPAAVDPRHWPQAISRSTRWGPRPPHRRYPIRRPCRIGRLKKRRSLPTLRMP
jgi:type IV secretion system protein TrbI